MDKLRSIKLFSFDALLQRVAKLPVVALGHVSRLVYPPNCLGCQVFSQEHGALCSKCWSDVQFISKPYCEITGHPFSHDLGEGIISADAIANPPSFKMARAAVLYSGLARQLVHRLKYKDRADLAHIMAGWMIRAGADFIEDIDCVVPVPLHRMRLLGRKYNQSAELARAVANQKTIRFLPSTLIRTKYTRPQVGLVVKARQENVKGAFKVVEERQSEILGRHVLLIDDVFTTGATVEAATKTLLKAGAREVSVLTFARVADEY